MKSKALLFISLGLVSAAAVYALWSDNFFDDPSSQDIGEGILDISDRKVEDCMSISSACLHSTANADGNTMRSACLHANAVRASDASFCEAISDASSRAQCVSQIDYSEVERRMMEEWGAGEPYSLDVKDQCYSDIAYSNRDTKYCAKVSDSRERRVCEQFAELMVVWPEESVAKLIDSSAGGITKKYQTLLGMLDKNNKAEALNQCELIPDDYCVDAHDVGQLRDKCLVAVATEYQDLSICKTIERSKASCSDKRLTYSRANCIADNIHLPGGNQALCDEITHTLIRATCYQRLETIKSS